MTLCSFRGAGALSVLVCALAAASASAQTTHDVSLSGFSFAPPDLSIDAGDTVRWTWFDGKHNVESGVGGAHDGNFRSGEPVDSPGMTFEVTFDQAFLDANPMPDDVYPYYCIVHLGFGMIGSITVEAGGGGPTSVPTASQWATLALITVLLAGGMVALRRQRRAAA